ncbi:hypothetical protein ABK040_010592 [Willaertia magna]
MQEVIFENKSDSTIIHVNEEVNGSHHVDNENIKLSSKKDLLLKSSLLKDLNQVRALFLKSFFLQLRQYKSNIFQMFFPVFCLLFIFILQTITNTVSDDIVNDTKKITEVSRINATYVELSAIMVYAKNQGYINSRNLTNANTTSPDYYREETDDYLRFLNETVQNKTYNPPEAFYIASEIEGGLDTLGVGFLSPYSAIYSPNMKQSSGFLRYMSPPSRALPTSIVRGNYEFKENILIPYSILPTTTVNGNLTTGLSRNRTFTNEKSLDEIIYDELGTVGRSERIAAVGAYIIRNLSTSVNYPNIKYTIQYDHDENGQFCSEVLRKGTFSLTVKSCRDTIASGLQNWMNDAFLRRVTGNQAARITTRIAQMTYDTELTRFQLADTMGSFFYPLILSLLLPAFTFMIVFEKESKLREMMKLMGMKIRYYFFVTFIFQYFLFIISSILFVIFSAIFGFRFITQTNGVITLVFFIGWGLCLVSFSFLLASVIRRTIVGTIASYMIVLIGPLCGVILELTVFENAPNAALPLLLIFPLQISHYSVAVGSSCNSFRCPGDTIDIYNNSGIFHSLIFMYGCSILYYILGLYIDAVLPVNGVGKHPLFFIQWIWKPFTKNHLSLKRSEQSKITASNNNSDAYHVIDSDVLEETLKVNPPNYGDAEEEEHIKKLKEENGVVIYNLEKKYGSFYALKGTNLLIGKSECFGLLGMNGAGKSTTISILSGIYGPSNGTCFIYGHDVRYDIEKIHKMMGLTAQFDILYPDLTCEEHLLFYSRLKGVKLKYEKRHVKELLQQVGLDNETLKTKWNPLAGSLSGGMKRRLSIAISLVADPKLILLDEPTTGLDPTSKRHLWNIILEQKKNRTIILTTHSMEEADVLCDRMTIMNRGEYHCLGNSFHLKKKFGGGYLLTVNFPVDKEVEIERYILDYIPEATKTLQLIGTMVFKIPQFNSNTTTRTSTIEQQSKQQHEENREAKDDRSVSGLFAYMEEGKKQIGIKEWAINQVSLEQVFHNIVAEEESKKEALRGGSKASVLVKQCLCN